MTHGALSKEGGPAAASRYFKRSHCPSCGGAAFGADPEVCSKPKAEDGSFEEVQPHWHGFFKDKVFFSYFRCRTCGLLSCKEFFNPEQLDVLYRQMPDNTAGVPLSALKKTQEGYFRALQRFSPLKGEFLEVGPDIGLFTECCVREGDFSRYWLFEPNREVLPVLEKVVAGKVYKVCPGMLDLDVLPDGALSVAVMVHVLDHLLDPKGLLVALRKKLAPGGVVLFVTHDESSLLAGLIGRRWPPYCVQHPHLFRPESMTKLMGAAGYRVLGIQKSVNHFPATYLAKHFLWALGLKIPLPSVHALTLPLKLGNIITVATPMETR